MLISFEGIDGSGKSTQIKLLEEYLVNKGLTVNVFREPGGNAVSESIRELLLNSNEDIHPVTELLLFSAARAQLVNHQVIPALSRNEIVILDRFFDSTTAYQGYGRGSISIEKIDQINSIASLGKSPDLTFYLRLDWEESKKRTAHMEEDRMEKAGAQFFKKVIEGFDQISREEDRFVTIDAKNSIEIIHNSIIESVNQFL